MHKHTTIPNSHEAGDQIYHTKCIVCHNKMPGDTSPFGPPNLYQAFKTKTISTPEATKILTEGKGQMPSFANVLTKGEMLSVISYLKAAK